MVEVLKFSATWCNPCKAQNAIIAKLDSRLKDVIKEIDIEENEDLVEEYGIRSVPTLIILLNGNVVEKRTGVVQLDQLSNLINKYYGNNSSNGL